MATATSTGSGNWSAAIWSGGSGSGGAPADGDAVVIAANHSVLMDEDLSAWTGLQTVTVTSHATTPGMLYWKDGTSGYLKIRTGYNLVGTNAAAKGRVLANSDGVWANTGALAFAYKAVILLEGSAVLDGTYLDFRLYCTQPTNHHVKTYKTKYRVTGSAANDTLTKTSHGISDGTPVMITVAAGGSLPAPLEEDTLYWTVNTTTHTFKLAPRQYGSAIALTTDGSGDIDVYDGHTNTSTGTINVLTDLTADSAWITTDGHDFVLLCNQQADTQLLQLTTINADSLVLSANINSIQYPGARIYLSSRNISIRTSTTSSSVYPIQYSNGGIFGCEFRSTAGQYGRYGRLCVDCTFAGTITNAYIGLDALGGTCSGHILGGVNGLYGAEITMTGDLVGVGTGFGLGQKVSGTLFGANYGITGFETTATGIVMFCAYPMNGWSGYCSATIKNNGFAITQATRESVFSGRLVGNTYDCRMDMSAGVSSYTYCRNALFDSGYNLIIYGRNVSGIKYRILIEDTGRTQAIDKIIDIFGDVIRTACDGAGDAPSVDPDGGNGYCIEASNVQSNCNQINELRMIQGQRIWLTAAAHTVTYKLQTTYAGITAGNLKLTCNYIGPSGVITETHDDPAIDQRDDDTDWSQVLAVTFTPSADGWATFSIDLMEYEAGNEVYVWPTPTIT